MYYFLMADIVKIVGISIGSAVGAVAVVVLIVVMLCIILYHCRKKDKRLGLTYYDTRKNTVH